MKLSSVVLELQSSIESFVVLFLGAFCFIYDLDRNSNFCELIPIYKTQNSFKKLENYPKNSRLKSSSLIEALSDKNEIHNLKKPSL
jgi:hypothetical protein